MAVLMVSERCLPWAELGRKQLDLSLWCPSAVSASKLLLSKKKKNNQPNKQKNSEVVSEAKLTQALLFHLSSSFCPFSSTSFFVLLFLSSFSFPSSLSLSDAPSGPHSPYVRWTFLCNSRILFSFLFFVHPFSSCLFFQGLNRVISLFFHLSSDKYKPLTHSAARLEALTWCERPGVYRVVLRKTLANAQKNSLIL